MSTTAGGELMVGWMLLVKVLLGIIAALLVLVFVIFIKNSRLPRYPDLVGPEQYGMEAEDVRFTSTDGLWLSGKLIRATNPKAVVVLCHGLGTNHSDVLELAQFLHHHNYHTFVFDFRGHGRSQGQYTSWGNREVRDLVGALQFLEEDPDCGGLPFGLLGISMGAAAVLQVAAEYPEIRAVVADSSYTNLTESIDRHLQLLYGLPSSVFGPLARFCYALRYGTDPYDVSPIEAVAKTSAAVFFINGSQDDRMNPSDAQALYDATRGPRQLWLVPGAAHLEGFALAAQEYERRVVQFFNQYLSLAMPQGGELFPPEEDF